jgi:hypothetical protein
MQAVIQDYKKYDRSDLIYQTICIAYPQLDTVTMRYDAILINSLSYDSGVPWELIVATNFIESRFENHLTSESGAKGKMQLLDRTAKKKAADIGMSYNNNTLWNSVSNMILGCAYLKEAMQVDSSNIAKYYVGGPNWIKSINQKYVNDYATSINHEARKLTILAKGLNGSVAK